MLLNIWRPGGGGRYCRSYSKITDSGVFVWGKNRKLAKKSVGVATGWDFASEKEKMPCLFGLIQKL